MDNFVSVVRDYWAQITALCGAVAFVVRKLYTRWKRLAEWRTTINSAILATLHNQLFAECQRILARDPVVITEEELENLEIMYKSYVALLGNGTIKTLMERVRKYAKIVKAVPMGTCCKGGENNV